MCVFMVRSRVKTERESRVKAAIEREWLEVLPLDPRDPDVVRVKSREGQERDISSEEGTDKMRFMLLYHGPATPSNASHEGWPEWFSDLGDQLVERGSPMADGLALRGDGSTNGSTAHLNGYSVIQADDLDQVLSLVKLHPYLRLGDEYSIEIHSLS